MIKDLLFIVENLLKAVITLDDLTEEDKNYIINIVIKAIEVISIELGDQSSIGWKELAR